MNLEEKEIKQFEEFDEITPESSQNLITDKGRFSLGTLYNAVVLYATELINAAVQSATTSATVSAQNAESAKNAAELAKTQAQAISDPENRIGNLQILKRNGGRLYLNGGYATTNCKPTFSAAQSLLFTYEVSEAELDASPWSIIGNAHIWSGQKGIGFAKNTSNNIQCGFNWAGNTTGRAFLEAPKAQLADGKPHAWALVCGKNDTNGFFKLYRDGVLIGSKTNLALFEDFIPTYGFYLGKAQAGGSTDISAKGRLSRVAFFNFDVSASDALYSLVDYQSGKSIPPTLNLMAQDVLTLKESDVSALTQNTYNLGDLTLSAVWEDGYLVLKAANTATITSAQAGKALNMSLIYTLPTAIPQWAQVDVSFDDWAFNTELFNQSGILANPVNQRYYGWFTLGTAKNSAIANTENIGHGETLESKNFKFTSTVKADKLYILPYNFTLKSIAEQEIAAGTVFAKVKGLKVKVNGAALNLENRLNSAQVRDISAGANHANIIGNIAADGTRNPSQSNYKLSWSAGQSHGIYCGANSAVNALAENSFNRIFVRSDSADSVNFKVGGAGSATQYSSSLAVSGGTWAQLDITTSDASRLYFTPTAALPSAVNLNVIIETRSIN